MFCIYTFVVTIVWTMNSTEQTTKKKIMKIRSVSLCLPLPLSPFLFRVHNYACMHQLLLHLQSEENEKGYTSTYSNSFRFGRVQRKWSVCHFARFHCFPHSPYSPGQMLAQRNMMNVLSIRRSRLPNPQQKYRNGISIALNEWMNEFAMELSWTHDTPVAIHCESIAHDAAKSWNVFDIHYFSKYF